MADFVIKTSDTQLEKLRKIAESEQISLEALFERLVNDYMEQHDYEDWHSIGLFEGSPDHIGRKADDVIDRDWKPTHRDCCTGRLRLCLCFLQPQ